MKFREKYQNDTNLFYDAYSDIIRKHNIGEFGIVLNESGRFTYIIGGKYCGGVVPDDMVLQDVSSEYWIVKNCSGFIYQKFPEVYTDICINDKMSVDGFRKTENIMIEWYEDAIPDCKTNNIRSAIWIPVAKEADGASRVIIGRKKSFSFVAILIAGMVFAGITTATLAYSKHEKLMHDLDINEKQVFNLYDMDREEFHSQYGDNVEVETVYDLPNKKAWMDLSEAEREEKLSKWIKELNERLERNHEK